MLSNGIRNWQWGFFEYARFAYFVVFVVIQWHCASLLSLSHFTSSAIAIIGTFETLIKCRYWNVELIQFDHSSNVFCKNWKRILKDRQETKRRRKECDVVFQEWEIFVKEKEEEKWNLGEIMFIHTGLHDHCRCNDVFKCVQISQS